MNFLLSTRSRCWTGSIGGVRMLRFSVVNVRLLLLYMCVYWALCTAAVTVVNISLAYNQTPPACQLESLEADLPDHPSR